MFTEDKVTEIFCMADDFCKFYDVMMAKYTIKEAKKRVYHRDRTLYKYVRAGRTQKRHQPTDRCLFIIIKGLSDTTAGTAAGEAASASP